MYRKLFLSCDFIDSQYLWILPFLSSYLKKKKIKHILLEKQFSNKILNCNKLKPYLNYNFSYLSDKNIFKIILSFFSLLKYLNIILKILFLNEKNLLKKENILSMQIKHSYWDSINLLKNESTIKVSIKYKLITFLRILYNIYLAEYIMRSNVDIAFVGHNVYAKKTLISILNFYKINIITQSNFTFVLQNKDLTSSWDWPKKNFYDYYFQKIGNRNINNFWNKRLIGKSSYEDANNAFKEFFNKTNNKFSIDNVVMFHIFKDSPFDVIDKERIFADYFHWIEETLRILKNSKENWVLRAHPSSKRWGENQKLIIQSILNKVYGNQIPKNIIIDFNQYSNFKIFKSIKRLITFSGTCHLEIGCFGIRPITISTTLAERVSKKLVLKPKNIKEYESYILANSRSKIFQLKPNDINKFKKILYIRENYFSMQKKVSGSYVYRGDNIAVANKDFLKSLSKFSSYENYLVKLGNIFQTKINNTVSEIILNEY